MKRKIKIKNPVAFAALLVLLAATSLIAEISLESAPPVVVKTVPTAGAMDVDPALTEIKVTYSKAMHDGSWSWSTWGEGNYPETTGEPRYLADGRTCVLPVKLQPGKFYAIWLNSDKFQNFTDTDGRPAVPYLLTFYTVAKEGGFPDRATFRPVVETILKSPERRTAELLDVDTGKRATNTSFGENDRETHAWVREHQLDLLGVVEKGQIAVLCNDMVIPPAPAKSFDILTAEQVLTNWHLAQGEPDKITGISPATDKTDTWFFRTREDGYGILQIVGPSDDPSGVKIRYKLVQKSGGAGGAGERGSAGPSDQSSQLLNDDQRAVLAWTDRQFRSYFDARTFDGWSEEERGTLERKLIDALNGPRSTEYYQAIGTLAALRSTKGLPRLREIAFERVDRNNRDRWMCIRALGLIGDKESVPELIHLVYHGNVNTHWWAQISLVQITGKNFGKDWNAWGKWWNDQNGQPPYKTEIIRWWNGQAEPDKLAESLEEGDQKFFESLKPKSASAPAPAASGDVAAKLRNAKPLMDGIRESWSSTVQAMQRDDATSALASLRVLAPRIQEFVNLMKGTALEVGAAESLETLKSLMKSLDKGDKDATQTALAAMTALGQKMEQQVKALTDTPSGSTREPAAVPASKASSPGTK